MPGTERRWRERGKNREREGEGGGGGREGEGEGEHAHWDVRQSFNMQPTPGTPQKRQVRAAGDDLGP